MAEDGIALRSRDRLVGTWKLVDPKDEEEKAFHLNLQADLKERRMGRG